MSLEDIKKKLELLKLLPERDKAIIREGLEKSYETAQDLLPTLSIFCHKYERFSDGDYSFLKYDSGTYYYLNFFNKAGIFFNQDKKFMYGSRFFLSHLNSFVDYIDYYLLLLKNTSIEDPKYIGSNFLGAETWFYSYGHFHDELSTLAFIAKNYSNFNNKRIVLDYPDDEFLNGKNFTFNKNYFELEKMAFNGNSLNLYRFKNVVLKLQNITFFENRFNSSTFHRFPLSTAEYITSQCDISAVKLLDKIFLTRGTSYRDVENKMEVEAYFKGIGYEILNPELLSIQDLIGVLARCSSVGLYWGSGMTNLAYAKSSTKVTIVKSNSYANENIYLWRNLIDERGLKLKVVTASTGNKISLADLDEI